MNWQPIKTAPQNGQTVDVWSKSRGRCADYRRVEMDVVNIFYEATGEGYGCIRDATHWKISESPEEELK